MLFQPFLFDDQFKEFALRHILHDEEELLGCLNDLVELDDIWVSDLLQDMDFPCHSLHVSHVRYPALLQHLHGHPLACDRVDA